MKKHRYNSLSIQLISLVLTSIIIGLSLFFMIEHFGESFIENYYMSEARCRSREEQLSKKFQKFIQKNELEVDAYEAIKEWCRDNRVYISVYDKDWYLCYVTDGTFFYKYQKGDYQEEDFVEVYYPISFSDVTYNVMVTENSEYIMYNIVWIVSGVIAFAWIILWLVWFSRKLIRRLSTLSKEVLVMTGVEDASQRVTVDGNDEISFLAQSVNQMHQSVVEHYEKEQKALQSNRELLTNLSHDIRTPLTTLLGYTEMMEKEQDAGELHEHAVICNRKAHQIQDMTDQMFRYFLVYNQQEDSLDLREYDARVLLDQIFLEAMIWLQEEGFLFEMNALEQDDKICLDLNLFQRVVDNVFSNLRKYAEEKERIQIWMEEGWIPVKDGAPKEAIIISLENKINPRANEQESTSIGVKSCEKMMELMGGGFRYDTSGSGEGQTYHTQIYLPKA